MVCIVRFAKTALGLLVHEFRFTRTHYGSFAKIALCFLAREARFARADNVWLPDLR